MKNKIDPSVKKILDMPSKKRRKIKFVKIKDKDFTVKKRKKKKHKKSNLNEDEIIEMIRAKGIKNSVVYEKKRIEGEPSIPTIRNRFGSWKELTRLAFGVTYQEETTNKRKSMYSAGYIIQTVMELGLWFRDDYKNARKKNPDIIAPYNRVLEEFGMWSNLIQICRMQDLTCVLEDYRILKRKMGRKPTLTECKKNRLGRIVELIDMYGSKKEMDKYVLQLDELEAGKIKSFRKSKL